jgi:hypothetical protein
MKILILALAILSLNACATLDTRTDTIRIGDPKERVKEVMGLPDHIQASMLVKGGTAWIFYDSSVTCFFIFSANDMVTRVPECQKNHMSQQRSDRLIAGLGRGLNQINKGISGMSDQPAQFQTAAPVNYNCTSMTLNGVTQMHCN